MLVSHAKRFIYLKTIKTAGTSVELFFERYCKPAAEADINDHGRPAQVSAEGIIGRRGRKTGEDVWYNHMQGRAVKGLLGDDIWGSYFKFCTVRNPFDRLVSLWWMVGCSPEVAVRAADDFPFARKTFSTWVLETSKWPADFPIYTIDGKPCVDDMIRYETLIDDLKRVCLRIGVEPDITRLERLKSANRKRPEHYRDYFDGPARKMTEARFADDLNLLGYQF